MSCRKRSSLWSSFAILFLSVSVFIVTPAQAWEWGHHDDKTVVKTEYGKLKGYADEDKEVLIWKGVPYANPPVGDLRWKAPEDPDPWHGVRDATSPAKKCTQLLTTEEWIRTGVVDPDSSEDCLYLDIYRPERHTYHWERLPVYVWIHGGSNNFGSARQYDGSILAARSDVVVVVVQYRLGPMGWFYHPALQKGLDKDSDSGNFGTLDHAQALKWIRKNISAFGGNPHNVTITGESAGAHNVMNVVVSPLGKGLFHHAMSESGGMRTVPPLTTTDYKITPGLVQADDIIEKVMMYKDGIPPSPSIGTRAQYTNQRKDMETAGTLESYLRSIDHAGDFFLAILTYGSVPTFPAIEDGNVIPVGGWIPTIQAGNHNKVPIILGSNEYESKSFMPLYGPAVKPAGVPSGPYSWFNLINVLSKVPVNGKVLTYDDVLPTPTDKDLYELTGYYGSRNWKAKFVDTVAHELAKVQDDVYAYLFKWGGVGSGPFPFDHIYGAAHAAEIPFFFGGDKGLFGYPSITGNDGGQDLQDAMMKYLENFAWTGNPNSFFSCPPWLEKWVHFTCLPKWKKWSNAQGAPKAIVFDADFHRAQIAMMTEELTVEGVTAELNAAISGLLPNAQYVARLFQFSNPW